ncbi:DUF1836 domain-containing protein [Neobacillus terrae]|uniref:DUF1836 domain-containing protein n=1 Tax=Neobacillus terrae TaxID=3034837 RepID=UPI00140C0FF0|nr:DUF1836 domain-containing protein [Neobacillus terrae]NHM31620.1 DUF1836 domain-containing protein [Neobacillus terrae]
MKKVNETISQLVQANQLPIDEIPQIDLYMDQVIQLFEKRFGGSKRNDQEKVLTKTMINNYAKGKLFFPIKNKKYSKEHLILISLIYQMKGALSINDIKSALEGLNEKAAEEGVDFFYESFLHLSAKNAERFREDVFIRGKEAEEEALGWPEPSSDLERALLITSLTDMSNLYRRAAERLVDGLAEERSQKIENQQSENKKKQKNRK